MLDFMWEEFHEVHDRTFGFNYRGQQDVELVNLRVRAVGRQTGRSSSADRGHGQSTGGAVRQARGLLALDRLDRRAAIPPRGLALDQHIAGPAIIEEYGSTIVMPPGWSLHADRYRNLILVSGR